MAGSKLRLCKGLAIAIRRTGRFWLFCIGASLSKLDRRQRLLRMRSGHMDIEPPSGVSTGVMAGHPLGGRWRLAPTPPVPAAFRIERRHHSVKPSRLLLESVRAGV